MLQKYLLCRKYISILKIRIAILFPRRKNKEKRNPRTIFLSILLLLKKKKKK